MMLLLSKLFLSSLFLLGSSIVFIYLISDITPIKASINMIHITKTIKYVNPDKVSAIVIPLFACLVGCFVALFIFPARPKINQSRADLSQLELTSEEKNSAKEKDLTTQSFRYVLTNKEINKALGNSLELFACDFAKNERFSGCRFFVQK